MSSGQPARNVHIRLLPILFALFVAGLVIVKGWQAGPFGRHQIVALSPQEESQLGAQAFQQHRVRDLKHWLAEAEPLYADSDKQRGQRRLPRP